MPIPPNNWLFIAYYYPPVKVVGAVRLFHLTQELQAAGWNVSVVSCKNRGWFQHDPGLKPNLVEIKTVAAADWRSLRFWRGGRGKTSVPHRYKKKRWLNWLARAQESFPFNFVLGDGGFLYILLAYFQAVRLIRRKKITHIFSSYRPYADHWVAFLLKLRFPKLYWIADFRDLHIDPLRHNVLWPRLQAWIDRRLLKRANLTTTVSQGLARQMKNYTSRVDVLRNAIPEKLLQRRPQPHPKFTIAYTGSIYPEWQDARLLFQALQTLFKKKVLPAQDLQIVYMGKDDAVWKKWMQSFDLSGHRQIMGELDREEVLRQQVKSSINLLLSWSAPQLSGVLTSKVYEYLSSGVPLLAIVNGSQDAELEMLIKQTGAGKVFYTSLSKEAEIRRYLLSIYQAWIRDGLTRNQTSNELLKPYTWTSQVQKLLLHIHSKT